METTPKTTLIEDMALTLKCQYISDLLSMTEGQQMKLYRKLKNIQPEEYTLFCWNDALNYLFHAPAQETVNAAYEQLCICLRNGK